MALLFGPMSVRITSIVMQMITIMMTCGCSDFMTVIINKEIVIKIVNFFSYVSMFYCYF